MENHLHALIKLKKYLQEQNDEFRDVRMKAEQANPWFTQEFILLSARSICEQYLDEEKLLSFARSYAFSQQPKKVGIVMAGNIPMVGFHDLLCGIVSGHQLVLKLSSKDTILMTYVIEKLQALDPNLVKNIGIADRLNGCDAYIATGSNQSNTYFQEYFGRFPSILRRNRTSIGVLDGTETEQELELLADDVHLYFGLGCRNITKLFVPKGYNFIPLINAFKKYNYLAEQQKLKNNYDFQLSLLLLNRKMYMSTDALLLVENENEHTPLSVLNYSYYDSKNEIQNFLDGNDQIQAIIGHDYIPFGEAQKPSLTDFADGVDSMQFLSSL